MRPGPAIRNASGDAGRGDRRHGRGARRGCRDVHLYIDDEAEQPQQGGMLVDELHGLVEVEPVLLGPLRLIQRAEDGFDLLGCLRNGREEVLQLHEVEGGRRWRPRVDRPPFRQDAAKLLIHVPPALRSVASAETDVGEAVTEQRWNGRKDLRRVEGDLGVLVLEKLGNFRQRIAVHRSAAMVWHGPGHDAARRRKQQRPEGGVGRRHNRRRHRCRSAELQLQRQAGGRPGMQRRKVEERTLAAIRIREPRRDVHRQAELGAGAPVGERRPEDLSRHDITLRSARKRPRRSASPAE